VNWPSFPFEGDLRVKPLDDPVDSEPPRQGEEAGGCTACAAPDEAYIWVNERWRVRAMERPTGLPMVLILESRSHLDLGDLPNLLAAELGVMTVRLERAIRSLDGVARVHVNRWGDGSAHLHLWFLARPYGRLQLRGSFLSLWDDILPAVSESLWKENLALVAAWLAEFGGRPLAEPPRIDWKAPATLAQSQAAEAALAEAEARRVAILEQEAALDKVGDGGTSDTSRLPSPIDTADTDVIVRRAASDDDATVEV
jgi:diadenosine tetraphosphate (Ap4A) HIT family hydrolase